MFSNILSLVFDITYFYFWHNRAEAKKIFVGGLPTEVSEKEFADYFGTFGLVKVIWNPRILYV